jgi:hypothetical protein
MCQYEYQAVTPQLTATYLDHSVRQFVRTQLQRGEELSIPKWDILGRWCGSLRHFDGCCVCGTGLVVSNLMFMVCEECYDSAFASNLSS